MDADSVMMVSVLVECGEWIIALFLLSLFSTYFLAKWEAKKERREKEKRDYKWRNHLDQVVREGEGLVA